MTMQIVCVLACWYSFMEWFYFDVISVSVILMSQTSMVPLDLKRLTLLRARGPRMSKPKSGLCGVPFDCNMAQGSHPVEQPLSRRTMSSNPSAMLLAR